jgi:mono/diheme cytochrome c family protein
MRRGAALAVAVGLTVASVPAAHAARAARDVTEGRVLYGRYCASCHGVAGDGRGPVASALVRNPADLRRLGERHGTPLPVDRLARLIDGRDAVTAHGPREMPVWGERFAAPEPEASGRTPAVDARIRRILDYLATIQRTGPSEER